jgi:glycosyltransferase involved in cell wall biosynthesis
MDTVSIVILTYQGEQWLRQTIESVLRQSYPQFELIIVDDASPDQTRELVQQYRDPRIRYIRHAENRGANQAWQTGLQAATGELIACLDQDDFFHPDKLLAHVRLHQEQPQIGVSYNARFEMHYPSDQIVGIWQPPLSLTLADLVLGFPFAPSDMVMRRKWALLDGIWDDNDITEDGETIVNGAEYVYCSRLFFAGCRFVGLPRALNYRRYHAGRVLHNLAGRCRSELRCQELVLTDPRCPAEVRALQPIALRNTYVSFAKFAFEQNEIELGWDFLRAAVRCDPAMTKGVPAPLVQSLVTGLIPSATRDDETMLRAVFAMLPPEWTQLRSQLDWAVARSHLIRGTNAILWGRTVEGDAQLQRAVQFPAALDESFLTELAHHLTVYEHEFGREAADDVLRRWQHHLSEIAGRQTGRKLAGRYLAARAFHRFRTGDFNAVPSSVIRAMWNDSQYVWNRGMVSIMARSLLALPARRRLAA